MSQQGSIAPKESAPELVASVARPMTSSYNAQERLCQAVSAAEKMVKNNVGTFLIKKTKTKLNSVAVVRKRTIPTERPPLVGEVSANLCG
jgi:hypothetical protein